MCRAGLGSVPGTIKQFNKIIAPPRALGRSVRCPEPQTPPGSTTGCRKVQQNELTATRASRSAPPCPQTAAPTTPTPTPLPLCGFPHPPRTMTAGPRAAWKNARWPLALGTQSPPLPAPTTSSGSRPESASPLHSPPAEPPAPPSCTTCCCCCCCASPLSSGRHEG